MHAVFSQTPCSNFICTERFLAQRPPVSKLLCATGGHAAVWCEHMLFIVCKVPSKAFSWFQILSISALLTHTHTYAHTNTHILFLAWKNHFACSIFSPHEPECKLICACMLTSFLNVFSHVSYKQEEKTSHSV
jgi:hypothetical protein